jgi:hypothetical protein
MRKNLIQFNTTNSISTTEANNIISNMNSKDFHHISIRDSNHKNDINLNKNFFENNDDFEKRKGKINFRNVNGNANSKSFQMKKRNSNK